MVFNDVDHNLYEIIKRERNRSEEHDCYFNLLAKCGDKVMNAVKEELRFAVQILM